MGMHAREFVFLVSAGAQLMVCRRPQTNSSPLSMFNPVGPNRLTLPPSQVAPNLLSNRPEEQDGGPRSEHMHPAGTLIEYVLLKAQKRI